MNKLLVFWPFSNYSGRIECFLFNMKNLPLCILLTMLSFCANGQEPCEICKSVLVQDYFQMNHTREVDFSYLSIIDQSSHRESSTKFALEMMLPVYGIPVAAASNFSQFDTERKQLFQKEGFDHKSVDHLNILKASLRREAYESFNNCMQLCQSNTGYFAYLSKIVGDEIFISVYYKKGEGSTDNSVSVVGADISSNLSERVSVPEKISTSAAFGQHITRNKFPLTLGDNSRRYLVFTRTKKYEDSRVIVIFQRPDGSIKEIPIDILAVHNYKKIKTSNPLTNAEAEGRNGINFPLWGPAKFDNKHPDDQKKCPQWCPNVSRGNAIYESAVHPFLYAEYSNEECGQKQAVTGWYADRWGSCCCGGSGNQGLQEVYLIVNNDDGKFNSHP